MKTENKKMLIAAITAGVVLLLFAACWRTATFVKNIRAIFACEIGMWVAILVLVDMTIGRNGAYFWWGFFLGPVGGDVRVLHIVYECSSFCRVEVAEYRQACL